MTQILYKYDMNATTWVYLSSLIMIAVYFKFRRFWSVRNLDLIGLIFFAPGLLLIFYNKAPSDTAELPRGAAAAQASTAAPHSADESPLQPPQKEAAAAPGTAKADRRALEQLGYLWLFVVSARFLFRVLVDPAMVRRPLLEPNLSASGLTFACASMLVFLTANVIIEPAQHGEIGGSAAVKPATANSGETQLPESPQTILMRRGPGYPPFLVFSAESDDNAKRITAIIAHLAIVLGMVLIGYRHFDNTHAGIAAATLYLLLPYSAQYAPYLYHIVPGALLVWAIQCYRRPVFAGIFAGLAAGLTWYPLFLLPLWCSFYWRRGLVRFSASVVIVLGLVLASLAFTPASLGSGWAQFRQTVGFWHVHSVNIVRGFWEPSFSSYRYPIFAAFCAMCGSMALWPAQKNLGTLLALSAAVMLGTQFWVAYDGGVYMAWYLPLMILTILRPNLEDRVALSAISEGWVKWRK